MLLARFGIARGRCQMLISKILRRRRKTLNKPTLSNYQKLQRRTTVQIIILFTLVVAALGFALYWYQRKNLMP